MLQRLALLLSLIFTLAVPAPGQQLDTLIDVGGYALHFNVIDGEGMPILFEYGGAFDGPPWNGMLGPVHRATGAPIIWYDRSGFGTSALNPRATDPADFGIENGMRELETALAKLGYDGDMMLVGHSYGAFYSALLAARHPESVKAVVLLNAQLPEYWTDERLGMQLEPSEEGISRGDYYLRKNFPATVDLVRRNPIPRTIPVIDLVAGIPIYFMTEADFADWNRAHQAFGDANPNVEVIRVHASGHYVFKDAPILFLNAVARAYADAQDPARSLEILRRTSGVTIELANVEPATPNAE